MRKTILLTTSICCFFALAIAVLAQAVRKPGLYETTATMTWQKSPFPPGMPASVTAAMSGPHTVQSCLTQAMIDKYGAPIPQSKGSCQTTNIQMKPTSMTAEMVCTGQMSGHGDVESSWTVDGTETGKVHFIGTMGSGPNAMPVEYTNVFTSVYKGPDCGSVKPVPMPSN